MNKLYDWLFWFNCYEEKWYGFKREDYVAFFNGDKKGSIRGSNVQILTNIIMKGLNNDKEYEKYHKKIFKKHKKT